MALPNPTDETPTARVDCVPGSPVPAPDFAAQRSRKRELLAEQRSRLAAGEPAPPEDFLARWPTDPDSDADVATLITQDLFARRSKGEPASKDDYSARFPKHRDSLAALVARHDLFRSFGCEESDEPTPLRFPSVGEELFGFRLRHELGRGAFARVFLAEQTALGDRPVAVKISAIEGREPQTLAQMQHTHIVPIYSVQEDERVGLRAVCMPYFGGASLSEVLKALWATTRSPVHGRELVTALEQCSSPVWPMGEGTGTARDTANAAAVGHIPLTILRARDYVRAVVWIVARLAEGLQHAHDRSVLHRDIKPANILVGADGQPMLLDFNLSENQKNGNPTAAVLGGTIAYMSPEHLRATLDRGKGLARCVDHRSDVYSLGMVLFEMLAGGRPFEQSGSYSAMPLRLEAMATERSRAAPSLRERRPDAPWSLESIVRKCLAPDPAERYQRSDHLAEDLRTLLEDRPLRHAPELSRVERIQKWTRRNPRLTSAALVALIAGVLLSAAGVALANIREHLAGTRAELGTAQARERKQAHEKGTAGSLCLVNTTFDSPEHLRQGVAACERTLAVYGGLDGETWHEHPDWQLLAPDERTRMREDTRELMVLLAAARVRLVPTDPTTLREALALLDRAENIVDLPPSRALWLERARYLDALGEAGPALASARRAEQIPVASAREHYLHATAVARTGGATGYRKAVSELDQALALDPRHYWSWFQRGVCHMWLREFVLAAGDFGHCTGLWPEFAWGHLSRGNVFLQSGKNAEAVACYNRALELDPDLVLCHLNRGLVQLELSHWTEALADFDRILVAGSGDSAVHAWRGVALEGLHRYPDADTAFRSAFGQLHTVPPDTRQRIKLAYGFAVATRLPQEARQAFRAVLTADPQNARALYGLAMIAVRDGQNADAVRFLTQAVDAAPEFHDARRYRAVMLARGGSIKQALEDINWCLDKDPQSGASLYAAACVAALAARHVPDAALTEQAIDRLEKAFALGVGPDKAATDPDLAGLKPYPKFQQLITRHSVRQAP